MGIADVIRSFQTTGGRQIGYNAPEFNPLFRIPADGTGGFRFSGTNTNDGTVALAGAAQNELVLNRPRFSGIEAGVTAAANQVGLEDRVAEERERGLRSAAVAEGIFNRQTRGRLSERQRQSANRGLSLTRRLAEAAGGSAARVAASEKARLAIRGAGDLEDQLLGTQLSGLTNLANAEAQRRIADAQRKSQRKADKRGLLGSLGGAALGLIFSSEAAKDKQGPAEGVLEKLKKVRVDRWNYKGDTATHIGPYAEEFNETFDVGHEHRDMISLIDAVGIALGAVKELNAKVEANG